MFQAFSIAHIITLLVSAGLLALLIILGRRNENHATWIARSLGAILLLNLTAYGIYRLGAGHWDARHDLPMQLCNWAIFAAAITAFTRKQIWFELSYFWVLAGSLQGVLTPDLPVTFPHIQFFTFFIAHNGLVITVLFFVGGLKMRPRRGSVLRVMLLSQIYFASAMLLNWLIDSNYGYLMRKPPSASLLDYMGPWPWYLLTLQGVGLVMYSLLYLPFYFRNRRDSEEAARETR